MKFPAWFMPVFTIMVTVLSFGFMGFSVFGPELAEFQQRMADTINGFLMGSVLSTIVGVLYGTSMGSKEQSETIRKVVEKVTEKIGQ